MIGILYHQPVYDLNEPVRDINPRYCNQVPDIHRLQPNETIRLKGVEHSRYELTSSVLLVISVD